MSTQGPDLFVICKSCGSEVSPYITECPYCGNRLRKRAPKIDRDGRVAERRRRRRAASVGLPRLRRGEIPGIRADSRPYATLLLVAAGFVGALVWRPTNSVGLDQLASFGGSAGHWWRVLPASFTYTTSGYAFAVLGAVALYGWLLERRHGPVPVVVLFLAGAAGGLALSAKLDPHLVYPNYWLGGNGGALALLVAWAVPDLLELAGGEEIDGDLIGTGVIAAVVAVMPLVSTDASWIADGVGAAVGLAGGGALAALTPR